MTEEEYNKKVKGTKSFCMIIGILFLLGIFINISQQNYFKAILSLGFVLLLYLFYAFSKNKKIAGPIIGIILGILYIVQLNIVSIVIGFLILVDSIAMFKYIKSQ